MPRVLKANATKKKAKATTSTRAPGLHIAVSRYYDQADLPQAFWSIEDEARIYSTGMVRWGWRQWIMLAPYIQKHVNKYGRKGLAESMEKWQKILRFPLEHRRAAQALSVAFSPTASLNIYKLTAFITALAPKVDVGTYPFPGEFSRNDSSTEAEATPEASTPTPEPVGQAPEMAAAPAARPTVHAQRGNAPPPTSLDAMMLTPIGAFAAPLRALLAEVLRDALAPSREFIREVVHQAARDAVIEAVGAPSTAAAPSADTSAPDTDDPEPEPQPSYDTPETVAEKIEQAKAVAEVFLNGGVAPVQDAQHRPAKTVPGQTFQDKLANAAQDLGIETHTKKNIVVVGLNHHVQQEVTKQYGRAYRFTFLARDELNQPNHLPASADALLLCRKRLNPHVIALVRRINLPMESIANTSQAVLWGLTQTVPDHHELITAHAHH